MKNNTTATAPATKVTALCINLLYNAKFTTKFINKTAIGEEAYKEWKTAVLTLRNVAYDYYKALPTATEEEAKTAENKVFEALRTIIHFVGTVPTADKKGTVKIPANAKTDSGTLFLDVVAKAVNTSAKIEVKAIQEARNNLQLARKAYKENCLTAKGIVKSGLTKEYIKQYTDSIEEHENTIAKLLEKANNSVYGTAPAKDARFLKDFEICFRKVLTERYNFTSEEAKADKKKTAEARKANRSGNKSKAPATATTKGKAKPTAPAQPTTAGKGTTATATTENK
jgi:hypothetical protein